MATTLNEGHQVKEKVKDAAHTAYDKASEMASKASDKASEMASKASDKADEATSALGSRMKSAAGTVRENTPQSGVLGAASEKVAETLERGGNYLEDKGLSGIADDVTGLIKRNPVPAVLIGVGIGYLIACASRR